MKREEQIQKLIDEETGIDNYGSFDYQIGVCDGVRLADKTMLDRAENYLRSKLEYRPILKEEYIHGEDYIRHRQEQSRLCDEFITAFREAMEGGEE